MPLTDRDPCVPIEKLPVELIRMVLAAIPDVRSLLNAVLSCPLFYRSFIDNDSHITPKVLRNQIDHTVLPEALAALDILALLHKSPDRGGDLRPGSRSRALRSRDTSYSRTSLTHTLVLGRLHEDVQYLTEVFVAQCLSKEPLRRVSKPITHKERCRIERAYYRFEMLCGHFRQPLGPEAWTTVRSFRDQFTLWELEELSCIHDFLARKLFRAFNDVAEHDIEWGGSLRIGYAESVHNWRLEILLSTGLQNIRRMIQAETYEARYALVKLATRSRGSSIPDPWGFAARRHPGLLLFPYVLAQHNAQPNIEGEVFADGDTGPHDVWRWAFSDQSGALQLRHRGQDTQRAWGYVLWDKDRLEKSGVFNESWEMVWPVVSQEPQEEADLRCFCMAISQKLRKRIYDKGGRGWWDWGDESRVKWPPFAKQSYKYYIGRAFTPTRRPRSLEEAREVWDMVREAHDKLDLTHVGPPLPQQHDSDTDDDL